MKKIVSVFWLCMVSFGAVSAQSDESKTVAFQLGFVPPLSTNGIEAAKYTNGASFNILAGISANEKAFAFAGLGNIVKETANGVQFAGVWNYIGLSGKGVAFAGVSNIVGNNYKGVQFAGVSNNVKELEGTQFAGVSNMASGNVKGSQFAGVINTAKEMKGSQFAGVVNIAGNMKGSQFAGVVNIAKQVHGVQVGVVNIAESSDCPVGLVNIIKNGEMGAGVTYDGLGNAIAAFRSGGKTVYGIIGVGYNHKISGNALVTQGGLGAHIYCLPWLRVNNEVKFTSIGASSSKPAFQVGYALMPAFRLAGHYEIFGGPTINYLNTNNVDHASWFPHQRIWKKHTLSRRQQLSVGYEVGVQYVF